MKDPIISLIIPVYNIEKYLEKSLKSVELQTFKDFEAIIIDDGSQDKSFQIIKRFCEKNSNFKLICQQNQGPAAARNAGLRVSKGTYIAFLDGDDFLEPTFLEKLYENAIKNDTDIVCCNFNFYNPKKDLKTCNPFHCKPAVLSKTHALKKLILDVEIHYFVWNKLYKRTLFFDKNIKFENMYFEDISISPKLFYYARKVSIIDFALYNYTSRENSILHSMNADQINDYIKSIGVIRKFLENQNDYNIYSNYLWIYAQKVKTMCYYYILKLHTKTSNFKDFFNNISSAIQSINYFTNKEFSPVYKNNDLEIPYYIKQPETKLKKK